MAVQYAFGKIVTQGLDLNVDAADPTSYPGSGTAWTSVVNRSITGSVVSCSFSSDFKGGIVFDNPSASVEFPGTLANYGTSSFTVEMAFRPTQIEGIHYLVSKNSGSYPNWGVYLSGSGGSGKLFAEYNIDASVSCSVSSSTTFETGSSYFIDAIFDPAGKRVYQTSEGAYIAVSSLSNGTGSLTTTSSLFLGNTTYSSSYSYSGSVFSNKIYSTINSGYNNYKAVAPRLGKPLSNPVTALALIVGGGGAGGGNIAGGGGAGGFLYTTVSTTRGVHNVYIGAGGTASANSPGSNGENTFYDSIIAYGGGGGGGTYPDDPGRDGASGGGASAGNANPVGGNAIYGDQGNDGADGGVFNNFGSGGGGGAGQAGKNGAGSGRGGDGGDGLAVDINGTLTYYAGGGGAGAYDSGEEGAGGLGGGGNGEGRTNGNVTPGSPNTGGGGGGGGYNGRTGADGGSGIVIIRYPGAPIATGGTITSLDGDTIHTFTETGSHTFTVF